MLRFALILALMLPIGGCQLLAPSPATAVQLTPAQAKAAQVATLDEGYAAALHGLSLAHRFGVLTTADLWRIEPVRKGIAAAIDEYESATDANAAQAALKAFSAGMREFGRAMTPVAPATPTARPVR